LADCFYNSFRDSIPLYKNMFTVANRTYFSRVLYGFPGLLQTNVYSNAETVSRFSGWDVWRQIDWSGGQW